MLLSTALRSNALRHLWSLKNTFLVAGWLLSIHLWVCLVGMRVNFGLKVLWGNCVQETLKQVVFLCSIPIFPFSPSQTEPGRLSHPSSPGLWCLPHHSPSLWRDNNALNVHHRGSPPMAECLSVFLRLWKSWKSTENKNKILVKMNRMLLPLSSNKRGDIGAAW